MGRLKENQGNKLQDMAIKSLSMSRLQRDNYDNPYSEMAFPLYFGMNTSNQIADVFKQAWENPNVEKHATTIKNVMSSLKAWQSSLRVMDNWTYLNIRTDMNPKVLPVVMEINFIGCDIIKYSLTVKDIEGMSPLLVYLKIYSSDSSIHNFINKSGHFFIRGEGEIDDYYRHSFNWNERYISELTVDSLYWCNRVDGCEQKLFGH